MKTNKERPYKVTRSKQQNLGRFQVIMDTLRIGDKEYPYSYLRMRSSVCILPVYRNKVVLIKQYRHARNEWLLEFPAGSIEDDETPEQAAIRELEEEAGYRAGEMEEIGKFLFASGFSDEEATLFIAYCSEKMTPKQEPTELIEVMELDMQEFDQIVSEKRFIFGAGIVAWSYARDKLIKRTLERGNINE